MRHQRLLDGALHRLEVPQEVDQRALLSLSEKDRAELIRVLSAGRARFSWGES